MKIAILASGGNSPGMNNAITTLVKKAISLKYNVYLVENGFNGILDNRFIKPDINLLNKLNSISAVAMGCARSPSFFKAEIKKKAALILKRKKINVLVVIGGDGSYKGAQSLTKYGIKVMCLPGTIDNDVASTNTTIGFTTCLNTIVNSLDSLRDSFESHNGICLVEVMGRSFSDLAIYAGIAVGAEAIVTLQNILNAEDFANIANESWKLGKRSCIFIITELIYGKNGLPTLQEIANEVSKLTNRIVRTQVIGYIQRGGIASAYDRYLASIMANYCIDCIKEKKLNKVISIVDNKLIDIDIVKAISMPKKNNDVKVVKNFENINKI